VLPVFNLSVKFEANTFIDDRYIAILQLRRFGCEVPIRANVGKFYGVWPLKLWNYCFDPKDTHCPGRHAFWDIARWNWFSGLIGRIVQI